VFEQDISLIHPGQTMQVQVGAYPAEHFNGRVAFIATQLDPTTRTLDARVEVDNVKGLLKPCMFATAVIRASVFQAVFGFNTSALVWIGRIAAFGMATQTGGIMLVVLREAIDRAGGIENITSLEQLRHVVVNGAAHRLRPKLLTEGVAIVGLVPMLWATGTGAEIMRPMAAAVLDGLLVSDEVIDLLLPVLFYWVRKRRWKKQQAMKP